VGKGRFQESGFRSQKSGVGSENEEHLLSAFCLLLTADCLLQLVGVLVAGVLARTAVYDNMSPPKREERTNNFKK
jgi:hypothetical protein